MFNPFAQSYRDTSLPQCYRRNEMEKRRAYDERIREIEHGSFSPLVFSTSGGMAPTANVVYKRIARVNDLVKARQALQQNHALDPVQIELLSATLCNHVPPWITLCSTSTSWSPHHHRHHGPCLLRWPGPMSELRKVAIIFVVDYSLLFYILKKKVRPNSVSFHSNLSLCSGLRGVQFCRSVDTALAVSLIFLFSARQIRKHGVVDKQHDASRVAPLSLVNSP